VVIGNGRAAVIEVDGPHHSGRNRRADDAGRDLRWRRLAACPQGHKKAAGSPERAGRLA